MKNSEIDEFKITPERTIDLLNNINIENGYSVPDNIKIARNKDLRDSLIKIKDVIPNTEFAEDLITTLTELENNPNNIQLHVIEFCRLIKAFNSHIESLVTQCKDSFVIAITTLRIFQLKSTEAA